MKLSIVTTLYHSQHHLDEFYCSVIEAVCKITDDYEIIMVNDGSPDASLIKSLELQKQNSRIKVIDLSRNWGEHKARMAGIEHASGDFIFLIQSDLEVDPAYLIDFWNVLQASSDTDMVYGTQLKRRGNWPERIGGSLFYLIFNLLSDVPISHNDAGCRLMTRRFANALLEHKERTIFFAGLCRITGFGQKEYFIEKIRSNKGSYSLAMKYSMAINALTSFSERPLYLIFYTGLIISTLAVIYTGIMIIDLIHGEAMQVWTWLIASLWFLGGLIVTSIGLLGIYISRIFLEVKQRPNCIIKHIYLHNY